MKSNIAEIDKKLSDALDYALNKRLVCSITRDMMVKPRIPFITEEIKPLNDIDLDTFVGLLAYGYKASN